MEPRESEQLAAHEIVASEVRACLARQRISGRQAAFRLGWTQPYLSRRLNGEIPFNVTDLSALADLLEIPMSTFLQETPLAVRFRRRTMFDKTLGSDGLEAA